MSRIIPQDETRKRAKFSVQCSPNRRSHVINETFEPFYICWDYIGRWISLVRGQSVSNCIILSQNPQRSAPVLSA